MRDEEELTADEQSSPGKLDNIVTNLEATGIMNDGTADDSDKSREIPCGQTAKDDDSIDDSFVFTQPSLIDEHNIPLTSMQLTADNRQFVRSYSVPSFLDTLDQPEAARRNGLEATLSDREITRQTLAKDTPLTRSTDSGLNRGAVDEIKNDVSTNIINAMTTKFDSMMKRVNFLSDRVTTNQLNMQKFV